MDHLSYILIALYACLFLVGFTGNLLVIAYYGIFQKSERTSHHIFKIQLAIADILVCIFVPVHMYEDYVMNRHIKNKVYRYTTTIPMYVAVTVSAHLLCGLSYERYRKITQPFAEPITKQKTCLICSMIWLLCLPLISEGVLEIEAPYILTDRTLFCFHMVILVVECVLPISFMLWCYRKIAICVQTNWITLPVRRQQNKGALKTLKQLILIFAICVTPGRILIVVLNGLAGFSLSNKRNVALDYAIKFAAFLFFINNAVNCLVYVSRDKDFRYWLFCQENRRKKFFIFRKVMERKNAEELHLIALMMGRKRDTKYGPDLKLDNSPINSNYQRNLIERRRKIAFGNPENK